MTFKQFLPYGLVQLRETAGSIYRVGGQSRWDAVRIAINQQTNWEWRWSHLDLFSPQVLSSLRTVIDAGANGGQWTNNLLRYAKPEQVLVLEPNPEMKASLEKLQAKHKCVSVHSAAVGEKVGTLPFHLTEHSHNGSLMNPHDFPGAQIQKTIDVPVITLDDLTKTWKEISLLKLDIQGAELMALRGAEQALKKTQHVFIEINFKRQYDDMALFPEVHAFLDQAGFELIDMSPPNKADGKITWADALYRRQ